MPSETVANDGMAGERPPRRKSKRAKSRGRKPRKPCEEPQPSNQSDDDSSRSSRSSRSSLSSRLAFKVRSGRRRPSTSDTATTASTTSVRSFANTATEDEIDLSSVMPTLPRGVAPRIDGAERELLEAHQRRTQRKNRTASMRHRIEGAEHERREREYASLKEELKDRKREVAKLERENSRLDDRVRNLESSLGEARESLSRVSGENQALEAKCTEYGAAMVESLKEVGRVRLAAREERTALVEKHTAEKRARETAEARLDNVSKISDERIHELSEDHSSEATARQDAEARCLVLDERLKESESRHRAFVEQHSGDAAARDAAEARCGALEEKLAASLQKSQEFAALLRQKQSKIESMDRSLDELERLREEILELEDAAARRQELEDEFAEAAASREELEEENRALSLEIADLHASVFDAELEQKVKANELEQQIEALQAECKTLATERDIAKRTSRVVCRENESLREQAAQMESSLARAQTEGMDRFRELQISNETLAGRCEALKTELETRKKKQQSVLESSAKELRKTRTETESWLRSPERTTPQKSSIEEALYKNLESLVGRCTMLETELHQLQEDATTSDRAAAAKEPSPTAEWNETEPAGDGPATELSMIEEEMRQELEEATAE